MSGSERGSGVRLGSGGWPPVACWKWWRGDELSQINTCVQALQVGFREECRRGQRQASIDLRAHRYMTIGQMKLLRVWW